MGKNGIYSSDQNGIILAKQIFFTKGVGVHREKAASFRTALRAAGLADINLVLISSIFPPGCKLIRKKRGLELVSPGEVVFCVYDHLESCEPGRLVAASVGAAIPADRSQPGYLSEHHAFGETEKKAGEYAEDLAATMLASSLGIDFDPNTDWSEREQVYRMSGKIVRSTNVTQSAMTNKSGLWTTVFAAAVLIT